MKITIEVAPEKLYSGEQLMLMINGINEAIREGYTFISVAPPKRKRKPRLAKKR